MGRPITEIARQLPVTGYKYLLDTLTKIIQAGIHFVKGKGSLSNINYRHKTKKLFV